MQPKTVHIHTVGCRANQADSSVLEAHFDNSLVAVRSDGPTDVVVVNTCCVTEQAERDCRKAVRRALRDGSKQVVVTGCGVSAFEEFIGGFGDEVVAVGSGMMNPADVGTWVNAWAAGDAAPAPCAPGDSSYFSDDQVANLPALVPAGRTRGLLKIQNGCSHNCAYCIVPMARGKEQSMPLSQMVARVGAYRDAGVRELVLTGVQIGAWGKDLSGRPRIAQAVAAAAEAFLPGRIRISSIEPWSVDEDLVEVVAGSPNICNHFHMPLQSGDDQVLRDMKRGYTARTYLQKVAMIRGLIPDAAIGSDVLCGFPTEDEGAFANTMATIETARFAYVHGFSYSARPGTRATRLYGDGDRNTARGRVRQVRAQGEVLAAGFRERQIGRTCGVLVEEADRGVTDTFLPVRVEEGKKGELLDCVVTLCGEDLCAKPVGL